MKAMNAEFAESSPDEAIDQLLQQLVQTAQQQPLQSPQRQLALNRLVQAILKSNRLGHPQRGAWAVNFYEDLGSLVGLVIR